MKTFNHSNFTILIVDDIKQNIQVLATILENEGYSIGFSLSGKEALETIKYTQFDLIMLDYLMPEMNGVEVCKAIKTNPNYANIPIIFITASHDEKILLEAFSAGAADYVSKPFKPLELLARIENHLKFKQAKDESENAAKIKSQFLTTMSHEIRTPLQAVLGIAELLEDTDVNTEQLNLINTLKSSGEYLLFIVNDILDFSKLEKNQIKLEIKEFNLTSLLDELLNLVSISIREKKLDITYFINPNIPDNLIGDSFRIRQILLNIIANAIKFTESGKIIINVEILENKNDINNQITLKFSIEDTGIGIDKNEQKQLFQSFTQIDFSTTREYGGTGLGLAICQKLVKMMGGEIGVESEINKGAKFWFFIPLQLPRKFAVKSSLKLTDKQAVIWDKNIHNCNFISINLNKLGIKATEIDKTENLINQLSAGNFNYNFIFINIDDQSLELVKSIIDLLKFKDSCKLILISFDDKKLVTKIIPNLDNYSYLNKPLTFASINQCINNLINSENIKSQPQKLAKIVEKKQSQDAKILLVEDNRVNQKVITLQLKKVGYQADVVNNGQECLDKLLQQNYDILLMDCQMPILDGYETTKIIRQQKICHNSMIIIGLTANVIEGEKEKCLEIGMNDYISKPLSINTLKETLNKWINLINN